MYELLPAFIIAMLCLIVVSLATGEPSKEIQEEFEEVRAGKIIAGTDRLKSEEKTGKFRRKEL